MPTDWTAYIAEQQRRPGVATRATQLTGAMGSRRYPGQTPRASAWDPSAQARGQSVDLDAQGPPPPAPAAAAPDLDAEWRAAVQRGASPQPAPPGSVVTAPSWTPTPNPPAPPLPDQMGALQNKLPSPAFSIADAMSPYRRGTVPPGWGGGVFDPAMASQALQTSMAGPAANPNPYGTGIAQPHVVRGSQYGPDGQLTLEDLGNPNLSQTDQQYLAGLGYYYNPGNTAAQQNAANWGVPGVAQPHAGNLAAQQALIQQQAQIGGGMPAPLDANAAQALQAGMGQPGGATSK